MTIDPYEGMHSAAKELIIMCRRHHRLIAIANRRFDQIANPDDERKWLSEPPQKFIDLVAEIREIDELMTAGVM